MKLFTCGHCGHTVYFENVTCLHCGSALGFDADTLSLLSLQPNADGSFSAADQKNYHYCANYSYGVCNWLTSTAQPGSFCKACSLNRIIPDLHQAEYLGRWRAIEGAKHRLVYQLLRMGLPVIPKLGNEIHGLLFDFKADDAAYSDEKVFTGHDEGVITINIAEADDIEREMARRQMDEVYRTLLGHFRHEIGHYYWDLLIPNSPQIGECRQLFGDDTIPYEEALEKHYKQGAPANWTSNFISKYSSAHPWEDWAETWAHYMHILDTLETASAYNLSVRNAQNQQNGPTSVVLNDPYTLDDFGEVFQQWMPLTFAMNSLNRSMGLNDSYPFLTPKPVTDKLSFIHQLVRNSAYNYGTMVA